LELMSFIIAETARPEPRPWRAARYQKMLRAATEALQAETPEAVSMDAIAQAAGVGKATLYRYFDSKESLLRACLEQAVDELGARMEAAEQAPLDPPRRLHRITGEMVEGFSRHMMPLRPLMQVQTELQEDWRRLVLDARRRLVRVLRQHFDRGRADGWYVAVDPDLVPNMIMGMIRSSVSHVPGKSLAEVTDGITAFVLRACLVPEKAA